MYVIVEFLEAAPAHVATARAALLMLARQSLEGHHCHQFDVAEDPLEPTGFLVYRLYADEAAWKAHTDTAEHQALMLTLAPWLVSRRLLAYDLISEHGLA
jgi:quinol monooxygenase YgiN